MFRNRMTTVGLVLGAALLIVGTALAASIDTTARTVTTPAFEIQFSPTNPEEISSISWNGSPNLTNTGQTACGDPLEYFGNAWAARDDVTVEPFVSVVGWGQTGTFGSRGRSRVVIDSVSDSASGCFGAADVPVETSYHFWDHGPAVNRIQVQRKFDFRGAPFAPDLRAYIPRLYPHGSYTTVYHPDSSGTTLLTELSADCELGCRVSDWDNSWFAVHSPTTGQGMIVRHAASAYDVELWVDQDGASETSATGVVLIAPPGGFTGRVSETEFLCFYDSSTWTPSLTLPPGC